MWDQAARAYDAERARDSLYMRCVHAARVAIERAKPERVLDVGCGTGMTTLPLRRSVRSLFAVDYSRESLRVLQSKAGAPPISQADICALPFQSGTFDAVLCANTLQHLTPAERPRAIRELLRVTRHDGMLVVTVHHYSRGKRRAGWIKEGKPGQPGIDYIFRFTVDELQSLFPMFSSVGAIGLQSRLEPLMPFALRRLLARKGYGHMLLATVCL